MGHVERLSGGSSSGNDRDGITRLSARQAPAYREVLLALHSLTAADATLSRGERDSTTTQGPETLLTTPEMLAFNQRVCLRRRVEPLTETEVLDYLHFRFRQAGADPEKILSTEGASLLHEYSGGIIRVIDNLLESALRQAAASARRLFR
jgi:hypothetical protein